VRRKDDRHALGHLFHVLDEHDATLLETPYDSLVMHDRVAHIERGAVDLKRKVHDFDGIRNARAKAPRCGEQDSIHAL
jgi:hypothetical protein